jgi:hypothetical protein
MKLELFKIRNEITVYAVGCDQAPIVLMSAYENFWTIGGFFLMLVLMSQALPIGAWL